MIKYKDISIYKAATISDALKQMDAIKKKLLLVLNDDYTFHSLISIGDIQRAIINNLPVTTPIIKILRGEVKVAHINDNPEDIKNHIREKRNDFMPVIDAGNNIVDIIFWEDLFKEKQPLMQFDLPVVIMAGGEGRRLKPLTNVLPKPLIPIGEKTVIEHIMDRFLELGSNRFFISLNYKAKFIEYYLSELEGRDWEINYFKETQPLGTAGSLHLLKGKITETFFISNCDIIVEQDYSEILNYHRENRNEITLVAAIKSSPIPYGVLNTKENGVLISIDEKPDLTHKINTGLYILEPHLIEEIPQNTFFHITQLIEKIIQRKGRVGVFPVSEKSWTDIGTWSQYVNLTRGE